MKAVNLNRVFKRNYKMAENTHMSLVIRKMKVKTTSRFHPTIDRMFKINKIIDSKEYWRGRGRRKHSYITAGIVN